jgi:hypothetical protein
MAVAASRNTVLSATNNNLEIVLKRLLDASDVRETKASAAIREGSGVRVKRSCLLALVALHNFVDCVDQFLHLARLGKHEIHAALLDPDIVKLDAPTA